MKCIILQLLSFCTLIPFILTLEEEFSKVTCASSIKLRNVISKHRLHSHQVAYGSGSRQQSVTTTPSTDDNGSYFIVQSGLNDMQCTRGDPIKCGQRQEVSANNPTDGGDNWIVHCVDSAEYWMREKGIRLQHVDTKLYLSSSKEFTFGHPISGQHEVAASKNAGKNEEWQTMEGIYFSDKNTD